jgi:hypothetical protein
MIGQITLCFDKLERMEVVLAEKARKKKELEALNAKKE